MLCHALEIEKIEHLIERRFDPLCSLRSGQDRRALFLLLLLLVIVVVVGATSPASGCGVPCERLEPVPVMISPGWNGSNLRVASFPATRGSRPARVVPVKAVRSYLALDHHPDVARAMPRDLRMEIFLWKHLLMVGFFPPGTILVG